MKPREKQVSSMFVEAGVRLQPPLIRDAISEDTGFLSQFGLTLHGSISIGGAEASFPSDAFYQAYRSLDSGSKRVEIIDESGRAWKAILDESDPVHPSMILSDQSMELRVGDLFPLSETPKKRIDCLLRISKENFLSEEVLGMWKELMGERPATERELEQFHKDIEFSPQSVARTIRRDVAEKNGGNVETLLPACKSYFESLIGKYDDSDSVKEYSLGSWALHCRSVSNWDPYFGFLQNLHSSGHSLLVSQIPISSLEDQDLEKAFQLIEEKGDAVSKIGAIELGMGIATQKPKIASVVSRLIEQFRDDDPDSSQSEFFVLSKFLVFVDGFLSQRGIFRNTPPFYRRLASLAHASFLHRRFKLENVDAVAIADRSAQFGDLQFHCQTLSDMRVEPRWIPNFIAPQQLRAEFLGRVANAAVINEKSIRDTEIPRLVETGNSASVFSSCDSTRLFLPGPLEGDRESALAAPEHFTEAVETQLSKTKSVSSSFAALVNGSLLFRLEPSFSDTAADLLIEGKQRIREISEKSELIDVLYGLAFAAAVSESVSLRDQVFILVRRYRQDPEFTISPNEALGICHTASAADSDLSNWCQTMGDWLTEFAFSELTELQSAELFSYLEMLLRIVPELWHHCGRAHAALQSIQKNTPRR